MALTEDDLRGMAIATLISSTLSMLGSIVIAASILILKDYKSMRNRILLFMSLSDIVASLSFNISSYRWLIEGGNDGGFCIYQAWSLQYFVVSNIIWTLCLSIYIYGRVVHLYKMTVFEKYFHIAAWGIPLVMVVQVFGVGYYPFQHGRWTLFYVWVFLIMFAVAGLYVAVIFHIRKIHGAVMKTRSTIGDDVSKKRKIFLRLAAYPIIFMLTWIPGAVNRMQNVLDPTNPIFVLYLLHVFFVPLAGFLNCIAYGWTHGLVNKFKVYWIAHFTNRDQFDSAVAADKEKSATSTPSGGDSNWRAANLTNYQKEQL